MKILIAEDDALLQQGLVLALEAEGYICDAVSTCREAQASLASGFYSLMILDLGLPDDDGLRLLGRIRRDRNRLPVLILTARDTVEDRIAGLDSGADDYLIKPFSLEELMARLRALIRRNLDQGDNTITAGRLTLDLTHRAIQLEGRHLELTPKEYAILARLMLKAGSPVHREILHNDIYNWQSDPLTNALEVHIHNLREKVGKATIKTVRGFGYALINNEDAV